MRGMWEYFTIKRAWAKKKGIGGCRKRKARRNTRSVAARVSLQRSLEQVKGYPDTDCSAHIMGRAFHAVKSGNWEGFKEEFQKKQVQRMDLCRAQRSSREGLRSCRPSIAQDILRKSTTDFLRRIIAPVDAAVASLWKDQIRWVSSWHGKRQCSWWCAACGQDDWRAPNRILVIQLSPQTKRKSLEHMRYRWGCVKT